MKKARAGVPAMTTERGSGGRERAMVRQKKEEKKIILIGIILACVVVAAGVGAYFRYYIFSGFVQ